MAPIRTQPAGPKAFRLFTTVRDTYRSVMGESVFAVYEALTYYVHPKTLTGAIPLKMLAQTLNRHPQTIGKHLHRLQQIGLIRILPQWDDEWGGRAANLYALRELQPQAKHAWPSPYTVAPRPESQRQATLSQLVPLPSRYLYSHNSVLSLER